MKIAVAQFKPVKGGLRENIEKHVALIQLALQNEANAIFFPELSVTGYEPELAQHLALSLTDEALDTFEKISTNKLITIGIGVPLRSEKGIKISLLIFTPDGNRSAYSKQYLHKDELPWFVPGNTPSLIDVDTTKIAPAICYESLLDEHSEEMASMGMNLYLASVAKPENGVKKAYAHYPKVAKKYKVPVLMSNCIGPCDNFISTGQSAVWNSEGELLLKMDDHTGGILVFETVSEEARFIKLE